MARSRPRRERANRAPHAGPQAAQLHGPEAPGLDQQSLERNTPAVLEFNQMPVDGIHLSPYTMTISLPGATARADGERGVGRRGLAGC
jgi:hypothetical protein